MTTFINFKKSLTALKDVKKLFMLKVITRKVYVKASCEDIWIISFGV